MHVTIKHLGRFRTFVDTRDDAAIKSARTTLNNVIRSRAKKAKGAAK